MYHSQQNLIKNALFVAMSGLTFGASPPLPSTWGPVPGGSGMRYVEDPTDNLIQVKNLVASPSPFMLCVTPLLYPLPTKVQSADENICFAAPATTHGG